LLRFLSCVTLPVPQADQAGRGAEETRQHEHAPTALHDLVEIELGIREARWVGHSFGGRLVAELAGRHPELIERAVLLDPAMHIPPATALAQAEGLRPDTSFATLVEAVDAKLADGTLFTTPRSTVEAEMDAHFEQGDDGRWRARFSSSCASRRARVSNEILCTCMLPFQTTRIP